MLPDRRREGCMDRGIHRKVNGVICLEPEMKGVARSPMALQEYLLIRSAKIQSSHEVPV